MHDAANQGPGLGSAFFEVFFAWSRLKFSKHVDLKDVLPAAMPLCVQAPLGPPERFAMVEMMFGLAFLAQTWCGAGVCNCFNFRGFWLSRQFKWRRFPTRPAS